MKQQSNIRKHFFNALYLISSNFGTKLLHFLYAIWVIRLLPTEGYGKFVYIVATISFFSFFIDSGLNAFTKREVAGNKFKTGFLLGELIFTKTILFIMLLPIFYFSVDYLAKEPIVKTGFYLLFLNAYLVSFNSNFLSIFHAHEKFKILAGSNLLNQTTLIIYGVILLLINPTFISLLIAQMLSTLTVFAYVQIFSRRHKFKPKLFLNYKRSLSLITKSLPFAAKDLFTLVYFKADIFILGQLKGPIPTGLYGAAYGLIRRLEIFPNTVFGLIYPRMASKKNSNDKLGIFKAAIKANMLLAYPMTIGGILIADDLIPFLFGSRYDDSIIFFKVLLCAFFFFFINNPLGTLIINFNKEKRLAIVAGVTALANVVGNLIFIPKYGALAAAFTTVGAELLVFIQSEIMLHRFKTYIIIIKNSVIPLVCTFVMGLVIYVLKSQHVLIQLGLAMLTYIYVLLIMEYLFNREVFEQIFNALFRFKKDKDQT